MKVLKIDSGKSKFIVNDKEIEPEKLSREDLLTILNSLYENKDEKIEDQEDELCEIKNPVEREIVQQIVQKISEFDNNKQNIRDEIESQFPDM